MPNARRHWMRTLAEAYHEAAEQHPEQPLLLVSDIDGTILDMRYMIWHVLQDFDRTHHTTFFGALSVNAIGVHENQVHHLLQELDLSPEWCEKVMQWYLEARWHPRAIQAMHRPFHGVMEMIRWFQLQPHTEVALLTGRPDVLREDTLRSLNSLGEAYHVSFRNELLYMNPRNWEEKVKQSKVDGIQHFRNLGYHVFAFIDNEPANLKAVSQHDDGHNILLLHADTIFESKSTIVPHSAEGHDYRLDELVPRERIHPTGVQLVWHGVNDRDNLNMALASDVAWIEVDARRMPNHDAIIVRGDSLEDRPLSPGESWLTLDDVVSAIKAHSKRIKIDFKNASDDFLHETMKLLHAHHMQDDALWFNGRVEEIGQSGFRLLADAFPGAIRQCPASWLTPLMRAMPDEAKQVLAHFSAWGVQRFSFHWGIDYLSSIIDAVHEWGYQSNIYGVEDLENFLRAILLLPTSVTSDFNFPQWNYYGRGPGKGGRFHTYSRRPSHVPASSY